ncbi:origin recognition complex subunit 3 N-terminus-domain-containing protein [Stachybotrys elegans]|uniref:Origin recognition complex subunit 3 N-terminus-domain-containing protein n=1 Tax=Stachybotrys elegans TaxID=80388 RepID=A0A8K0WVU0_9HYPO|nr:origin recognition complex subunit 3 N-terminus-domain-containing protein [Stachybotrys elegans]
MASEEAGNDIFTHEDHQAAYVFDPEADDDRKERPSKRRRVSKQSGQKALDGNEPPIFVPLLNGQEKPDCVQQRQALFEASWAMIDERVQEILRDSNSATLDQVSAFVDSAGSECMDRIPAAFVITGPNIASQDLLFEQLSDRLQQATHSKFVGLRSTDTTTLKAALKKIIRDITAQVPGDDEEDEDQIGQQDRKYLDYDLEALNVFTKAQGCEHIFVAIQDSEGFDSGLLSELITLFHSWRPQIPFTLLFGIATSVDLLQARLLKSSCRVLYGAQFDVVQSGTILETVFKSTVASCDVSLRLGVPLLQGMLSRQQDQVAGIQAFIGTLKYSYMSHFYANPLSILVQSDMVDLSTLQPEHFEAVRNLPSFRDHVEQLVNDGTIEDLQQAKSLIEDDDYLLERITLEITQQRKWREKLVRSLLILKAAGAQPGAFSKAYTSAMADGITESHQTHLTERIRRLNADEVLDVLQKLKSLFEDGDAALAIVPDEEEDLELREFTTAQLTHLEQLKAKADEDGTTLRSKYSGQGKVMRTTVIAQKVQLSRDSAALRDEDKQMTDIIDQVTDLLSSRILVAAPKTLLFSECWLYDSRLPSRDAFVPRPRAVFERSLTRPHDYLGCECCKGDGSGVQGTSPATAVLYHLYQETGNLINVADLWAAFSTMVGEVEEDERNTLFLFYRGLAELRTLGFVKSSKKKADHIAKLKWL